MSGRIIVAGASGLIGSELVRSLRSDGTHVVTLVRHPPRNTDEVEWQPATQPLDPSVFAGATAVVNLCGASIGKLPWTRGYRAELLRSRLQPTTVLVNALEQLGSGASRQVNPGASRQISTGASRQVNPGASHQVSTGLPHLVNASAVGIYGSRPGLQLNDTATPGTGFLADLCTRWEVAAQRAESFTSVTTLRTASLLHPRAVLKPMIPLAKLGVSGPLGTGTQFWPWISLTDEVRAIRHVLEQRITGSVNLAAPQFVTAREVGSSLADAVNRPFWLPAPAWALRIALGSTAANELLLSDVKVVPQKLIDSGFKFVHHTAEEAIRAVV